jgi:hypothetical protein
MPLGRDAAGRRAKSRRASSVTWRQASFFLPGPRHFATGSGRHTLADSRRLPATEEEQDLEDREVVAGERRPRAVAGGQEPPIVRLMPEHRVEAALYRLEIACANAQRVEESQEVWGEGRRLVSAKGEAGFPVRKAIDQGACPRVGNDGGTRRSGFPVALWAAEHGRQSHEAGKGLVARQQGGSGIDLQQRQPPLAR